jgi:flagellar motor switch protein FliN/FliY
MTAEHELPEKEPAANPVAPGPAAPAVPLTHLDLLLDVPLEATLRFGSADLLLRDVLSAAPGTLIELNRELQEPADLLVAGKLIARGEVVVINGCFGLRVTQLVTPLENSFS